MQQLSLILLASFVSLALSFSRLGTIRPTKSYLQGGQIRGTGGTNGATRRTISSALSMSGDKIDDFSGYALLFDCDGVIVETEEMHRVAYNAAFKKYGLKLDNGEPVVWSVECGV